MNDLPPNAADDVSFPVQKRTAWRPHWRWLAVLLVAVVAVRGGLTWQQSLVAQRLEVECRRLEAGREWSRLLVTAQEWQRAQPYRREPLQAGVTAAKALRQPASTAAFLRAWPKESVADVPWLSTLAELQLDPLKQPVEGAATCREIIRLDPHDLPARQRLIFFDAVTMQPALLLKDVRAAARSACDLPEFFVYAFLVDGLRLNNALERIQRWTTPSHRLELLMVAYALHSARVLEGSIPSIEEDRAAALRRSQEQRADYMQQLHTMFPENHEVLAYDLEQAVEAGQTLKVAECLGRATPVADDDHRFWRARGWLFMRAGDLSGAGAAFREALALNSMDWRLRHFLADWHRRSGNLAEAEVAQRLAARGRRLESELLAAPSVRSIPVSTLQQLADFATDCDDTLFAQRIRHHAETVGDEPPIRQETLSPTSRPRPPS